MLSAPAAITISCVPDKTACAANCTACCELPHCLSIVTAGTLSGSREARTALRANANPCSPACVTQPKITSSIAAGSTPELANSAFNTSPARSAGCQAASLPLRRPPAVRTASTISASAIRVCPLEIRFSLLAIRCNTLLAFSIAAGRGDGASFLLQLRLEHLGRAVEEQRAHHTQRRGRRARQRVGDC